MSIEQGLIADERLLNACADILKANGIEAFGTDRLHWLMPPELIEKYMTPGLEGRIFGYPVHMEMLLGESTVVLMETVAVMELRDPE